MLLFTNSCAEPFFELGSSVPTGPGKVLLGTLAHEIGALPNTLAIEGHTDSRPFGVRADYSNWELSTDRANAARRWMEENGVRDAQVKQVRGYADQTPRESFAPDDPSNRRITVIVQYEAVTPGDIAAATGVPQAAKPKDSNAKAGPVVTPPAPVKPK